MTTTNPPTPCNRRLSRAARELVHRKLARTPLANQFDLQQTDLWSLLEHFVPTSCLLHPSRDVLRDNEQHTIVEVAQYSRIPVTPAAIVGGPSYFHQHRQRNPWWYRCGYCQKVFTTRYYLDQHLDRLHATLQRGDVCPGDDWCRFLSLPHCLETALELEPAYGPGSGGHGDDAAKMERQWTRQAHNKACSKLEMSQARAACHAMIGDCFDQADTALGQVVCGDLTCESRLHRLWMASSDQLSIGQQHWHEWQAQWEAFYNAHHSLGLFGGLLLGLLIIVYLTAWCHSGRPHKNKQHKGNRLLRRSSSVSPRKSLKQA